LITIKTYLFTYSVLEKEGAAGVAVESCELVLRRGERAKWRLLIVYENAILPARNKVGPGLASLVQTYHAAVQPEKIYTSLFWEVLL
jgi:hypothetical protein